VGRLQERKGKAFCYPCWKSIFGKPRKDRQNEPMSAMLYQQRKGRKQPLQKVEKKVEDKPKKRMMSPQEWIQKYRYCDD